MKNIKSLFLLVALIATSSLMLAQGVTDANGRETTGQVAAEEPTPVVTNANPTPDQLNNGSDQDVPGEYNQNQDQEDWVFPDDLDMLQEEIYASSSSAQVAERLNLLSAQVERLIQANEELRQENQLIRQNFNNCCNSSDLQFSASDAYIMQNSPNPFKDNSVIKYFVPQQVGDAQIEVRNTKGEILYSLNIVEKGLGEVSLKSYDLSTGTYIYTLVIGGELIDSKVMIITK